MSGENGQVSNNISPAKAFNVSASPKFVSYLFGIYDHCPINDSISFDGIEEGSDICNRLIITGMWLSFQETADETKRTTQFVQFNENGRPLIQYDEIIGFIIRYFAVLTIHGAIWVFDKQSKRYRENKSDIEKLTISILRQARVTEDSKVRATIDEILYRIKTETSQLEDPFNQNINGKKAIAVSNGIILLPEKRLVDNSPAYGLTYCNNAKYDPAVDTKTMENYLTGLVNGDEVWKLKQMGASCLIREAYKKSYFIYNRTGNNGKSTYLNILTAMLGKENISALTLQEIAKDKFRGAELYGKSANICPELPLQEIHDPTYFKAITGEDLVTAERKYQDPFTFQNKALLIFGANTLPRIGDMSPSVMKRLVLIEFPNTFQIDPNFTERLTTEDNRSALLNIFLDYLVEEVSPKGVRRTEDEYENTLEAYRIESNSVYRFFLDHLDKCDRPFYLPFDQVYQAYVNVMGQEKAKAESKRKFKDVLVSEIGLKVRYQGPRGEQEELVEGVRWKQQHDSPATTALKGETWG